MSQREFTYKITGYATITAPDDEAAEKRVKDLKNSLEWTLDSVEVWLKSERVSRPEQKQDL